MLQVNYKIKTYQEIRLTNLNVTSNFGQISVSFQILDKFQNDY